ncbi:hypothetical protein DO659_03135 [Salmonella enterica subsp. enterica serovar Minnesota]|nr:hypothetical protein [Salmonella enterica subsp. enterica serovar Minnesota]
MKKEDAKCVLKEIKGVEAALRIVRKRINEGRYRYADEGMQPAALKLNMLAGKLHDLTTNQE